MKVYLWFPLIIVLPFAQRCVQSCEEKELELMRDIKTQIKEKENVFFDMEAYLPKRNGWVPPVTSTHTPDEEKKSLIQFSGCCCCCVYRLYLNLVLGNVNVTLLSNQAK